MIDKGIISAVNGGTATVVPSFAGDVVSRELVIPWSLQGFLEPKTAVVYATFEDGTGIILARMDGKWSGKVDGGMVITGGITADAADIETVKAGTVNSGPLSASSLSAPTITANGVSLSSHTHNYDKGGTGTGTTSGPK